MLDIFDLDKIWFGKDILPMFGKCILDRIKPNVFQSKMVSYIWFGILASQSILHFLNVLTPSSFLMVNNPPSFFGEIPTFAVSPQGR